MADKKLVKKVAELEGVSEKKAAEVLDSFSSPEAAQEYVNRLSEDPEGERFKNSKGAIPRLVHQAIDAGASLREVASILKTDEASVSKILGIDRQEAIKIEFDVPVGDEFDTDFSKPPSKAKRKVDKPDVTLTDLMAQSRPSMPSVSVPSVDRPDVTLTDLMAQPRPAEPSTPSVAPDPASDVLKPLRKEISPMGTYGMTREEFEAARGPRIGDVKRSDIGGVLKDVDLSESLMEKVNALADLNQKMGQLFDTSDKTQQEDPMACLIVLRKR